jgi:hypothetical protein
VDSLRDKVRDGHGSNDKGNTQKLHQNAWEARTMNSQNRSVGTPAKFSRRAKIEPLSYRSIVGGLLSEMAHMIRATESREFAPPFKLVIINSHGAVVFSGEVGRNGKLRQSSPLCNVRRSHFPAKAIITDGALALRTFRIDRPTPRGR